MDPVGKQIAFFSNLLDLHVFLIKSASFEFLVKLLKFSELLHGFLEDLLVFC